MPNKIQRVRLKGTIDASGDAEVYSKPIRGKILAVHVDYPAATCTVDIDTDELKPQKIIDLSAANTDAVYYPRTACEDNNGSDLVYLSTDTAVVPTEFVVIGRLKLTVASGTEDQVVTVDVYFEEY